MASGAKQPVMRFGVIADVQYADKDNGHNYAKTRIRYYRSSLDLLKKAVSNWCSITEPKVAFVLQLGDLIDGLNRWIPHPTIRDSFSSELALERTLEALNSLDCPVYHAIGNHELYNFSRETLRRLDLNPAKLCDCMGPKEKFYFQVLVHPKLRVVVLDTYEISCLGVPKDSCDYLEAHAIVTQMNKNEDLNSTEFLEGTDRRFARYNGACSKDQLLWLDDVLRDSEAREENVIVIGHCPIGASDNNCLCWNYTQVSQVLHKYSCVLVYLAGHDHDGHILRQEGLLQITLPGVVETPPTETAFVNGTLFSDTLVLEGGNCGCPISEKIVLKYPLDS